MANDEWRTPEWVWRPYAPFRLDAAANEFNSLASRFISKEMDALTCDWREAYPPPARVWLNPPYSQAAGPLSRWVEVARGWQRFYEIIMLLPADTSTAWFHRLWEIRDGSVHIDFLKRRVRHLNPKTGKPGGSPKFGSLIAHLFLD